MPKRTVQVDGDRLREERQKRILTQEDLANAIGTTIKTISRIEGNKNKTGLKNLRLIVQRLNQAGKEFPELPKLTSDDLTISDHVDETKQVVQKDKQFSQTIIVEINKPPKDQLVRVVINFLIFLLIGIPLAIVIATKNAFWIAASCFASVGTFAGFDAISNLSKAAKQLPKDKANQLLKQITESHNRQAADANRSTPLSTEFGRLVEWIDHRPRRSTRFMQFLKWTVIISAVAVFMMLATQASLLFLPAFAAASVVICLVLRIPAWITKKLTQRLLAAKSGQLAPGIFFIYYSLMFILFWSIAVLLIAIWIQPSIQESTWYLTVWNFTISPITGLRAGSYSEAIAALLCIAWAWLPVYAELYLVLASQALRNAPLSENLVFQEGYSETDDPAESISTYYGKALRPSRVLLILLWQFWAKLVMLTKRFKRN